MSTLISLWVAKPIQPSEAAKLVAAGIGKHDWIPGPASLGSFIPLPLGELARLYATNTEISRDEETTITGELPEIASVVHPTDFADLVREYRALESVGMGPDTAFVARAGSRP